MLYQEAIDFDDYFRCYCLGGKDVLIMPYEPRNEFHQRYQTEMKTQGEAGQKLLATVKDYTLRLCQGLGYDFNTVEFAVRGGVPIAIDFGNPAPDADINSVGPENFEWVVEHAANLAIARAKAQKPGHDNLTWGTFVQKSARQSALTPSMRGSATVGESVSETNDLGANPPQPTKKAAAPKKAAGPKAEPITGAVPAAKAPAKAKKPVAKPKA